MPLKSNWMGDLQQANNTRTKPGKIFPRFKEGKNFNRRNTPRILGIKI